MLRALDSIINYRLEASDGEFGRCKDFLFDDEKWVTRYIVVDTGKWLPSRKVLISPISVTEPDWENQHLPVKLSRVQIENSPPLAEHEPVSRKFERLYFDHFAWPYYWVGDHFWGTQPYPLFTPVPMPEDAVRMKEEKEEIEETHLRSYKAVKGYHIEATDGAIGHVEDFILDDDIWGFRYMVVDTRKWLPGGKVLISLGWIESVDWLEKAVKVDLNVEMVKNSPEYDPSEPINREYETVLYDYYGRPQYWQDEDPYPLP
ncbi:MAG: PRC-barrel domain containing protein [Deltaproteobacteria bacterium]|nr:PRC-barrel domain containing protein [Deltaproteobacteria bacterium]